jgi:hypothetical protein
VSSDQIPIFINGRPYMVASGCTLGELLSQQEPELAAALLADAAYCTDGRGIRVTADVVVVAGQIFRVIRSQQPAGNGDA